MTEATQAMLGRDGRPLMKIADVVAMLGIHRSTFYDIEFFRTRTIYVVNSPRIDPVDVDLYILNQKGARRRRRSAA